MKDGRGRGRIKHYLLLMMMICKYLKGLLIFQCKVNTRGMIMNDICSTSMYGSVMCTCLCRLYK